jgi:hypothetical protein
MFKKEIEIKLPVLIPTHYLVPNPWNPNKVAKPEMDLLRVSIKKKRILFSFDCIKKNRNGIYDCRWLSQAFISNRI